MKEIIITGSNGFVANNLRPFLESKGYKVIPISLKAPDWKENFPKNAFAVVHLAGLAHDLKNTRNESDYFRVNTGLTQEVYDLFLSSEIKQFLYFSSVKAVADSLGNQILDEDHVPNPATAYGKSKLKAEQYILSKKLKADQKLYIFRPCMIHGAGNKGNLNLLYSIISKGVPYPFAAFENERSFLSIDNLNFIIHEFFSNSISSGVYNVADTEFVSTVEIIQMINEVLKKNGKVVKINKNIIKFVATIGDKVKLPFNTEKLNKLTESYKVSNKKLIEAIGKKLPNSAKEGLLSTIKSFTKE